MRGSHALVLAMPCGRAESARDLGHDDRLHAVHAAVYAGSNASVIVIYATE
jgi:hypothetical protein